MDINSLPLTEEFESGLESRIILFPARSMLRELCSLVCSDILRSMDNSVLLNSILFSSDLGTVSYLAGSTNLKD